MCIPASFATYIVYLLETGNGTFYTGCTNNLEKRLHEHNTSGTRGAKYLRGRRPVRVVWTTRCRDKSSALKTEYRIKQLSRAEKARMAQESSSDVFTEK
ncbi:MAG: GIY-YIG nuclease family protein [Candidatus Omnitrophica bacterium]|nr:GIY-YIG nuclease family protein [Candidatus Omnitrophota bacterium]